MSSLTERFIPRRLRREKPGTSESLFEEILVLASARHPMYLENSLRIVPVIYGFNREMLATPEQVKKVLENVPAVFPLTWVIYDKPHQLTSAQQELMSEVSGLGDRTFGGEEVRLIIVAGLCLRDSYKRKEEELKKDDLGRLQ